MTTTISTQPAVLDERVHTVIDSPVGPLTLLAVGGTLAGVYMDDQRHRPPVESFGVPDAELFDDATAQLQEYFDGERTSFDLPLAPIGTAFQQLVWAGLCQIPYGETTSY
nr:hypothetical protein [Micromonospora sp. DSM 115978]